MTEGHAQEIGQLQAKAENASQSITQLFDSNEKRKGEITGIKFELQTIQHTVDETNKTAKKVVEFMKELKESVERIETSVTHIDERVSLLEKEKKLERERFDWVKVSRWVGTWRGAFVIVTVSAMLIGAIFPDAREWISSLIGLAAKAAS